MPQQSTALLNWASLYSTISPFLSSTTGTSDWLRIFISPDATGGGHFITHGIDFGATYANGSRGLVPGNSGVLTKTFLRGDGWSALWSAAAETAAAVGESAAQQLAAKEAYLQSTIASVYDIKQWITQSFTANNAMRFKGKIVISGTGAISTVTEDGTTNGFPTSCEVGDTYKIDGNTIDANSYIAGEYVSTGDLVVCIKSGSGNNLNDGQYWTIVQDNVEHLITYTLNGTAYHLYAQGANNITLYAPSTAGTLGQVLVSNGSGAPGWVNLNTLVVAEAGKVTYALVKSTGITMTNQGSAENSYDGSKTITIGLAAATTSAIGGVIVDNGTHSEAYNASTNTSNTPYPTISVSSGEIYLTKQNIINALGFTPGNSTVNISKIVVAGTASGNANTTSATANPYVNIVASDNSILGSYRISGSGKIGVKSTANSAAIVVDLSAADSDNYGGIKLGYSESGKNYAIQLDSNGKAFVNVPWVSDVFTASANGLAPMASDANKTHTSGDNTVPNVADTTTYILGSDAKWYKLPSSAFQGDRRIIKSNGTTIIAADSGNALDIIAGSHLTLTPTQSSGSYTGALTFDVIWRDILIRTISGSTITLDVQSIGNNDPLVFDNTDSIFLLGKAVTVGSGNNATTKTVVEAHITWYNMDTGEYEMI